MPCSNGGVRFSSCARAPSSSRLRACLGYFGALHSSLARRFLCLPRAIRPRPTRITMPRVGKRASPLRPRRPRGTRFRPEEALVGRRATADPRAEAPKRPRRGAPAAKARGALAQAAPQAPTTDRAAPAQAAPQAPTTDRAALAQAARALGAQEARQREARQREAPAATARGARAPMAQAAPRQVVLGARAPTDLGVPTRREAPVARAVVARAPVARAPVARGALAARPWCGTAASGTTPAGNNVSSIDSAPSLTSGCAGAAP